MSIIDKIHTEIIKLRGIPEWLRLNPILENKLLFIRDKYFFEDNTVDNRLRFADDVRDLFGKNIQVTDITTVDNISKGHVTFSVSDGNKLRTITFF